MGESRELLQNDEIEFLLNDKEAPSSGRAAVEQLPGDGEVTMRGELDKIQLADIFQTLAMSKMEGQLRVRSLVEQHELFFQDGYVRSIPPQRTEIKRIGQRLLHAGLIAVEQLRSALVIQKKEADRQLGEILVSEGFIKQSDVDDVFANQVQEDLFALFTWPSGSFEFYKGPCRDPDVMARLQNTPRFEVNGVLLEVARRGDEWQRVIEVIGDLDEILEKIPDVEPEKPFTPEYETVVEAIDGKRNVRVLADHTALGLFMCGCIVRDLMNAGFARAISLETGLAVADAQCQNGDLKMAAVTYHMLRRRSEAHPIPTATALAKGLQRCGEPRWAARVLVAAARSESDPIEALKVARLARRCSGRSSEVLEFLRVRLRETGADATELVDVTAELADVLAQDGDTEEALQVVLELEQLVPGSHHALNRKAKILSRLGQVDEAIATLLELAAQFTAPDDRERLAGTYEQILKLDHRRKDVEKLLRGLRMTKRGRQMRLAVLGGAALVVTVVSWLVLHGYLVRTGLEQLRDDAFACIGAGDYDGARRIVADATAANPSTTMFERVLAKLADHDVAEKANRKAQLDEKSEVVLATAERAITDGRLVDALELYEKLVPIGRGRQEVDEIVKHRLEDVLARMEQLRTELAAKLPPRPNLLQSHEERQRLVESAKRDFDDASRRLATAISASGVEAKLDLRLDDTRRTRLVEAAREVERLFTRCDEILAEHEHELSRTMIAQRLTPLYEAARRYEDQYDFEKALDAYRLLSREHPDDDDLKASFRERVERYATIRRFMQALQEATERGDFATARGQLRALQQAHPDIPFAELTRLPVIVETIPAGAKVFVDGMAAGQSPLSCSYTPGRETRFRIELDGYRTEETAFKGDEVSHVRSTLARRPDWEIEIGAAVESAPVLDGDGRAFVVDRDGRVTAFDTATHALLWQVRTDDLSGLLPRPVLLDGDTVAVASIDGTLRAFARSNGKQRWSIDGLPSELDPVVVAGTVVVATTDRRLIGVACSDGSSRFELRTEEPFAVRLAPLEGRIVVAITTHGNALAVRVPEGEIVWRQSFGHRIFVDPCAAGRSMILVNDRGRLAAIDHTTGLPRWSQDGFGATELAPATDGEWVFVANDHMLQRLDLATGTKVARYEIGARIAAAPTAFRGLVFVPRDDRVVEVLDAATLTPLFVLRDDTVLAGAVVPLPTGAGGIATFADGTIQGFGTLPGESLRR